MKRQLNVPTVQYCIEAYMAGTKTVVDRFTIEQVETGVKIGCCDHPNYNTIQAHLRDLSVKTGLDYEVVVWGDVFDRSRWIAGQGLEG